MPINPDFSFYRIELLSQDKERIIAINLRKIGQTIIALQILQSMLSLQEIIDNNIANDDLSLFMDFVNLHKSLVSWQDKNPLEFHSAQLMYDAINK